MSKYYLKSAQHQAPCDNFLGSSKELGTLELRAMWDMPHTDQAAQLIGGAKYGPIVFTLLHL